MKYTILREKIRGKSALEFVRKAQIIKESCSKQNIEIRDFLKELDSNTFYAILEPVFSAIIIDEKPSEVLFSQINLDNALEIQEVFIKALEDIIKK